MASSQTLEKAYRQHLLWPQIHAATDVFLRRKWAKAGPYELTWRLIHLWESVVITLAQACTARIITSGDRKDDLRAIREKCYGKRWNDNDSAIEKSIGALDGSIDKWIEILNYIASLEPGDSPFLASAIAFLNSSELCTDKSQSDSSQIDVSQLVLHWRRACDAPVGIQANHVPVRSALKFVNSFRNRFAHVPFPFDVVQDIFVSLEDCTWQLFSVPPSPLAPNGTLAGALSYDRRVLKGAAAIDHESCPNDGEVHFLYGLKKSSVDEHWPARPFVHVDNMLRPYVLTRMKDEAGLWEYTRYLAESNAVVSIAIPEAFDTFPIPTESEYTDPDVVGEPGKADQHQSSTSDEDPGRPTQDTTIRNISDANLAIRQRRFDDAIKFLEELVKEQPEYHVGWLKLGTAKRELAVDRHLTPGELHGQATSHDKTKLLNESLEALSRAKQHTHRSYKAEASYQASKTHYRKWQLSRTISDLNMATSDASDALNTYPESRFESWIEYLLSIRNKLVHESINSEGESHS